MIRELCLSATGFFLSLNVFANSGLASAMSSSESLDNRWSILASLGYGSYPKMYHSDGRTLIGRLAFAAELLTATQGSFGLELGVQTGNRMRFIIAQSDLSDFNCTVHTTMKPMIDLLVAAYANPVTESLLFTQIKGGIAYRHWKMNSYRMESRSEIAGELQAGLGYPLTEISNLNLLYQGVFGSNPKFYINPTKDTGAVTTLPIQHGVLLGFSVIA